MKRLLITLLLVVTCIFAVSAYENEEVAVFLDGSEVVFDVKPQIIGGRTMVPLRAVFETMGAVVEWDDPTRTVTATKGDTVVVTTIGSDTMYINGVESKMDVAPLLLGGRTLAPARFVAEAFGGKVLWSDKKREAYIFSVENSTERDVKMAQYAIHLEGIAYPSYRLLDSEKPGFVGRWFEKEIEGVNHTVTLSDGSTFYFLTDGADSFDVNFTVITTTQTPYFAYSIDGSDPTRQHITDPTVKLPDNGIHTVCIWADGMTEGEGKWVQEKGFALKDVTVNEGTVVGLQPKNKVIAYYGDSITEGIRALNMNANSDGNSATNAYPYFCSKMLGTVTHSVGYGATGVISVGSFHTFINAISNISLERPEVEGFVPDLIVVNHGHNDQAQSDQRFREHLIDAINALLAKYPDTPVFYAIPYAQHKANVIREVCAGYPNNITVIETAGWPITFIDGVHPDSAGAKVAGEGIAKAILEKMGEDFFKVQD
ncbi:MAG: hypothetical protein IJC91_05175 [Oscillospiraceae bacterium]|nr:hypothetical protein [Oscillospiraceae bacterium]